MIRPKPWIWALLALVFLPMMGLGQEVGALQRELERASTPEEKMSLRYQLAEAYLRTDARKSIEHAKAAHNLATTLKNPGMAAQSSFLVARGYERLRNDRNQEVWLRSALKFAKQANDADLIIKSVEKLSRLAIRKKRDYRKAYQIVEEAFNYFSKNGRSISELERQYDIQRARLARERKSLEREKQRLENEILALMDERDRLRRDKTVLTERQRQLEAEKQQVVEAITEKEQEIQSVSEERARALHLARKRKRQLDALELARQMDSLALVQTELELQNIRLREERGRYFTLLLAAVALFLIILAGVLFLRFRAKQRATAQLAAQNKIIEEERQRSDELLLNILPAPIARELKEQGKAAARKFPEATVLFSDFRNFTVIAESLTPEKLVEEIDTTFKAFDHIIAQYPDIEKIKTIGDAYMCASGLSDRKTLPFNLVRAALEMQQYLEEVKQEKIKRGEPYFEARIGLHTGPVVAGVVGHKKFAYDIWGDTVNIAARMEECCEVGKVNISETTYRLVKYKFHCRSRGSFQVKNKGPLQMYYVLGMENGSIGG